MNAGSFFKMFMLNAGAVTTFCYIYVKFYHSILFRTQKHQELIYILGSILAGSLAMYLGMAAPGDVRFDLRYVPIILAPFFVSNKTSIFLISIGIGLVRLSFGLNQAAYTGAMNMVIIGTVMWLLTFLLPKENRHFSLFLTSFIYIAIGNVVNIIVIALLGVIDLSVYLTKIAPINFFSGLLGSIIIALLLRDMDFDVGMRKQLEEEIVKDPLTGLFNYRFIDDYINSFEESVTKMLSVVFIDIDGFKGINDAYGHTVGDLTIKRLAAELQEMVGSGTVTRYAGEEFLILLPDAPLESAYTQVEMIRRAIEQMVFDTPDGAAFSISVSCGIAAYPDFTIQEVKSRADEALHEAKMTGRNRVCVASPILAFSSPL